MKRFLGILLSFSALFVMLTLYGCSQTNVDNDASVTLTFIHNEKNISVVLTDDEAEKLTAILDSRAYHPAFLGMPSCGFDKDISLTIDGRTYAIARDKCEIIQDLENSKFFSIPSSDMEHIRSVFEKYGGYFPCV